MRGRNGRIIEVAPGLSAEGEHVYLPSALDEIELGAEERRYDVPHGTWRLARKPAGFRATICAGTPTWLDGAATGARPETFMRPNAFG